MKYFIANWKANKTLSEVINWADQFSNLLNSNNQARNNLDKNKIKIVICPPSPFIIPLKKKFEKQDGFFLGSQDLSQFEQGTYTGEVTAKNLKGLVEYVIIGHAERRKNFQENEQTLFKKTLLAKKYNIKTIYCLGSANQSYPKDTDFVSYDPSEAISTGDGKGQIKSIEEILSVKINLNLSPTMKYLYGGSVNEKNVHQYFINPQIDGFLIGGASLDPSRFFKMIFG